MSETQQPPGWSVDVATVRRNPYWLIAKRIRGRLEVLTTSLADGRGMLPVFRFEEEAALFLRLGVRGSWRVRRTEAGELVSLLYGLCQRVELVALDPISARRTDAMNRLVSIERGRFVDVLLRRKIPVRLPVGVPRATLAL